jgi:hypothetical protein
MNPKVKSPIRKAKMINNTPRIRTRNTNDLETGAMDHPSFRFEQKVI